MDIQPIFSKIGRPKEIEGQTVTISLTISRDDLSRLNDLCGSLNCTKSALMRGLLAEGLKQAEASGVLPTAKPPKKRTSKAKV